MKRILSTIVQITGFFVVVTALLVALEIPAAGATSTCAECCSFQSDCEDGYFCMEADCALRNGTLCSAEEEGYCVPEGSTCWWEV